MDVEVQNALLDLTAKALDEAEASRIATENRIRSMRSEYGLTDADAALQDALDLLDAYQQVERLVIEQLQEQVRNHPLGSWIVQAKGIGLKQGGRLLAAIGDPYMKPAYIDRDTGEVIEQERPRRGPAELWQYAGHGDPERSRRRRGQQLEHNPEAKMRLHLVAESCIKSSGPYRAVYDNERAKKADATHTVRCVRCGPSGSPALPGSPWSKGHQHAHALRVVGKTILKDLFNESKRLHKRAARRKRIVKRRRKVTA